MSLNCDQQLYEWSCLSVHLSVCPSVGLSITPFSQCSFYRVIMKLSGVIAISKSEVHTEGQDKRSKVKVTEVKKITQFVCFWTIIPVLIHRWLWNNAQSLKWHRRGALFFLDHPQYFIHGPRKSTILTLLTQIELLFEFTDSYKTLRKSWNCTENVPYYFSGLFVKFQGRKGRKNNDMALIWAFLDDNSSFI